MEYIISPLWATLETLCMMTFLDTQMPRRLDKKKRFWGILAWILIVDIFVAIGLVGIIKHILVFVVSVVVSFIFYRGSWLRHLFSVIIMMLLLGIADIAITYGMCAILQISYSDFVWKKLQFVITVTVSKLLPLFLTYVYSQYRKKSSRQAVHTKWLLLAFLFPVASLSSIVVIFIAFQNYTDIPLGIFIYICILAVANIAILYLLSIMEKQSHKEYQTLLLKQQIQVQSKSILALEESYRSQRKTTHEYINQLQTISSLLAYGEIDSAMQYVNELQGRQTTRIFAVNTHHPILDAVFNQKYQQACRQGTQMRFSVNDLSGLNISSDELVVVFSNLLDNALEACKRIPDGGIIDCRIVKEENLFISIRNTSPKVLFSGDLPVTTKQPPNEHGFGLQNVCHILDYLNGEYVIDWENGWFCVAAELPIPDKCYEKVN